VDFLQGDFKPVCPLSEWISVSLIASPIPAMLNTAVNEFFAQGSVGNINIPALRVILTDDDPATGLEHLAHSTEERPSGQLTHGGGEFCPRLSRHGYVSSPQ
jgi:hypothetical protein